MSTCKHSWGGCSARRSAVLVAVSIALLALCLQAAAAQPGKADSAADPKAAAKAAASKAAAQLRQVRSQALEILRGGTMTPDQQKFLDDYYRQCFARWVDPANFASIADYRTRELQPELATARNDTYNYLKNKTLTFMKAAAGTRICQPSSVTTRCSQSAT